jgi:hypothetical protein
VNSKEKKVFKLGQEYLTNGGLSVRIVSNDANFRQVAASPICNVIGVVTQKTGAQALHYYSDEGYYAGSKSAPSYDPHHLISDEPTEEETSLINDIIGTVQEFGDRDANTEASLLKIVRRLRKK